MPQHEGDCGFDKVDHAYEDTRDRPEVVEQRDNKSPKDHAKNS